MYGRRAGELRCDSRADMLIAVRDIDTIDSELRLLAAVRRSIREHGGEPSSRQRRRIVERATPANVQATAWTLADLASLSKSSGRIRTVPLGSLTAPFVSSTRAPRSSDPQLRRSAHLVPTICPQLQINHVNYRDAIQHVDSYVTP
jgi:hypothetical protein